MRKRKYSCPFFGLPTSFLPLSQGVHSVSQSKVGTMNEINSWTQSGWYAVGSFLIQLAFLISAIWFARNILKTARAFQEQIGALLKLSITAAPTESQSAEGNTKRYFAEASTASPLAEVNPFAFTPPETRSVRILPQTQNGSVPPEMRTVSLPKETRTIFGAEPAEIGTNESVGAWRYMVRWLQTPMRSSTPRGRIMRWLQAPSH